MNHESGHNVHMSWGSRRGSIRQKQWEQSGLAGMVVSTLGAD